MAPFKLALGMMALVPSLASSFTPQRGLSKLPGVPTCTGDLAVRRAAAKPASPLWGVTGGALGQQPAAKGGKSLWNKYQQALEERPIFTKAWSSAIICGAGDILSQLVSNGGVLKAVEPTRLLIFSIVGGLYIGPVVHYWFKSLEDLTKVPAIAKRLPKRFGGPLLMLSLDQSIGASCVNSGFLISLWLTQALVYGHFFPLNKTADSVIAKISREFWPMLLANWKLWPFANAINFTVVPSHMRVLFANVVSVVWNMYLSASANR